MDGVNMKWSKVALFIFFVIIVKTEASKEEDLKKCKTFAGYCLSVTVTRTVLNSTDNEFFKVENEGPDATLHVLQGFDESTSNKHIEVDAVTQDEPATEYYKGLHGPVCTYLPNSPEKPYSLGRQLVRMLFDQYKECSSEPKEYKVPTGFSGVFSVDVPPSCNEFEMIVKLWEDENAEIADLMMIVKVVPDSDTECN